VRHSIDLKHFLILSRTRVLKNKGCKKHNLI
jgi:hypothetical protein